MHTIQIFGVDAKAEELTSLLRDVLPDGASVSVPQKSNSVNMDAHTLELIIQISKDVLVAAITMIGAVWSARVAARSGKGDNQSKAPEVPKKGPVVEIETLDNSHVVVVDERFEQRIREVVPDNVRNVLNIRIYIDS